MNISGKVALVTGGAGGIGKALVEILLQKHAKAIFMVDIDEDGLKLAQQEFEKEFGAGKVHICKCDVSSKEQMEDCFKNVISAYGELHIVCNNAGICDEIDWEKTLDVNLRGVIIGTKLAVQYMQGDTGGGGVIINTSSFAGLSLFPSLPIYSTTKLAIIGFSRQIATFDALVAKKKIRVNVICPHTVDTPIFTKMKKEKVYVPVMEDTAGIVQNMSTPQEFAQHYMKLIEESHHGDTMYVPAENAQKTELIADETKGFREHIGLADSFLKLRDAASMQAS
ncbi:15-hydroxyprostaglandin dehydrogenase [NAD(+)]-like [Amphiura filiformis]|uniref:15-hydroxyprostaglandin dehydrogenase [NAD(+)]-like n=1 Tax=Amphiura filiformis TaxID=82378 RepID=UPI003B221E11